LDLRNSDNFIIKKLIQELDKKALDKVNDYSNFNDFDSLVSN